MGGPRATFSQCLDESGPQESAMVRKPMRGFKLKDTGLAPWLEVRLSLDLKVAALVSLP